MSWRHSSVSIKGPGLYMQAAFPSCNAIDNLWNRKPVSRVSPVTWSEILLPRSFKNSKPLLHQAPETSQSNGTIAAQLGIFGNFLGSRTHFDFPSTDSSVTDIGSGECVSDCHIPCDIPAAFPRDDGRTIRSHATVAESGWFFYGLDLGVNHWLANYVIDDAVTNLLASTRLASKFMQAELLLLLFYFILLCKNNNN